MERMNLGNRWMWTWTDGLALYLWAFTCLLGRSLMTFCFCGTDTAINSGSAMRKREGRINTFMCVREAVREVYSDSLSALDLHEVRFCYDCFIWWRWYTEGERLFVIPSDSLFSSLFMEVKPVFLVVERPTAHDWIPDICHFPVESKRVFVLLLTFSCTDAKACPVLCNNW